VPNNESLVTFKVISPEVAALIAFNCAALTLPVIVTSTDPVTKPLVLADRLVAVSLIAE